MKIPIYQPYFPPGALDRAHEALASSWVSSIGPYLEEAEARLKSLFDVKHCVLTSSGSAAMHLVALSLLRKHPGISAIFCPNNVYAAAWNAFLREGYRIILIDANPNTWNFDLKDASGPYAILAVHNLGNVVNVPRLQERFPNNPIVEDNCEGLFGKYENQWTGTASLASATSFYGNKTLTAGESGAFFTNDDDLADFARSVSRQGQSETKFVHDRLGFNYRMSNVAAAILCGQLDLADEIRAKKARVFARYKNALTLLPMQVEEPDTSHAQWMFGVRIPGSVYPAAERYFSQQGIETRPMFYPASAHTYLRGNAKVTLGHERVAAQLNRECVILPSYPGLLEKDQDKIIATVLRYEKECAK